MRALPLLALLAMPGAAEAALSQQQLTTAVARPSPAATLPATLAFTDQRGERTTLDAVAAGKPLVFVFADFTCRHVCGPGLSLTAAALHGSGLQAGRDYRLAVVGLDPKDSLADARAMAARIDAPDVLRATVLLSGDAPTIAASTRALGYGYVYDTDADQFAHDASVYVFGGDGRLRALLPEMALTPPALRAAIAGPASAASLGFVERVAHLCYGFAAAHGRYGRVVVIGLQAGAIAMLATIAAFLLRRKPA